MKKFTALFLFILIGFLVSYGIIKGDSAIYFVYFKNFFSLPFSFQNNIVSYGATSPLHVVIFSFIYRLPYWIIIAKIFNFTLIAFGLYFIIKLYRFNSFIVIFIILLNKNLIYFTGALFETGIVFFLISACLYTCKTKRYHLAVILSGLLYLARPELILLTIVFDIYILSKQYKNRKIFVIFILSIIPALIYISYMYKMTGAIMPTSSYGRFIRCLEDDSNYFKKLAVTAYYLIKSSSLPFYALSAMGVLFIFIKHQAKKFTLELILLVVYCGIYLIVPPKSFITRYILPITPIMLIFAVSIIKNYSFKIIALPVIIFLTYIYSNNQNQLFCNLDKTTDHLLLKDLAERLNPQLHPDDKILIYEIQGQFYLKGFCISADSIVGNHFSNALTGKETFSDFIKHENIKYIVTYTSFNYRPIYNNTLFEKLYVMDLKLNVGDYFVYNDIKYKKIMTNPNFSDTDKYSVQYWGRPLNDGTFKIRKSKKFLGWDSVFKVVL